MKRFLLFCIALVVAGCGSVAHSADQPAYDFRKIRWGMNPDQVKATEGKPVSDSQGVLAYDVTVDGYDVSLYYTFVESQLVSAMYAFKVKHNNPQEYLDDFAKVKAILQQKYGVPKIDKMEWKDNLYKNDPEHWGLAVSVGVMICRTIWENNSTQIGEALWGDNFEVKFAVRYSSKALAGLAASVEKKNAQDVF